jgi:hypothetical protein
MALELFEHNSEKIEQPQAKFGLNIG